MSVCNPKNMAPGEKIALARNAKSPGGWSQYDLAKVLAEAGALGIDQRRWRDRIANYEKRGNLTLEAAPLLAEALGIDLEWLTSDAGAPVKWTRMAANAELTSTPEPEPLLNLVPYWGIVPCGNWERPEIGEEELIEISESVKDKRGIVAVKVSGNSMAPRFLHGETVAIRLSTTPIDGVVTLAVNQDGEFTLKLLRYVDGEYQLHSLNPAYGYATAHSWSILGHAVHREETDMSGLRA